jgi:hypothetical protein
MCAKRSGILIVLLLATICICFEAQAQSEKPTVPSEMKDGISPALARLESSDTMARLETLYAIWKGELPYDAGVGDALVAKYEKEPLQTTRWMILWVLHKYRHPRVNGLLALARTGARPSDMEILKSIESDLDPKDPNIEMRVYEAQLQHIETLTARELEKMTYGFYADPVRFKYDSKAGDALASLYPELPKGRDFYQARFWILKVLQKQQHPAFPAFLERLKHSDDPDERKWAAELESPKSNGQ